MSPPLNTPSPAAVLRFWLEEVGPSRWYRPDEALDADIARRFGEACRRAAADGLGHWPVSAEGALALLILLDQLPRNIFRGRPEAHDADDRARAVAKNAVGRGLDLLVEPPARQFYYLPLMHSESLQDQARCVRLCLERLPRTGNDNDQLSHAIRHRAVIRRFGRFPRRNAALGRRDTAAERAYRADGGYMG